MSFAITVARKPVDGSVARNTLAHGTGGLNIGKCRLAYEEDFVPPKDANVDKPSAWTGEDYNGSKPYILNAKLKQRIVYVPEGRFPANLLLQHEFGCRLDRDDSWECDTACPISGGLVFFKQVQPDPHVVRGSQDFPCPDCGQPYRDHPLDHAELSYLGKAYLHVACDGTRIKT